ncbi:MAG: branched-chain amino acid ABC transporter permease [Micromonosporaceae bacterium]|nr:branched-chain amino acid ABC transporter permease [Micromonosporaceae bacterium]
MTTITRAIRLPRTVLQTRAVVGRAVAIVLVAAIAVWLIFNLWHSPTQFFQAAVIGLGNGTLYALIALGYTLVYGIIELINFAHGDLFMLGTLFSGTLLTTWLGLKSSNLSGWGGFLLTLVAAMLFCALINVAIEFFAYRRLRRAPKLAPLITAVGMSFILQQVGLLWNGSKQRNDWYSVLPTGNLNVAGVHIDYDIMIVAVVTVVLLLVMTWVVTRTKAGKAMRATAQDQDAARLMGINVNLTISFTFAVGGALAGAAGLMYQQIQTSTRYDLGFEMGLIAFTAAVLGGIGNLTGAVLGGVLIGLIQGLNDGLPYGLGQKWSQSVVFTVLILVLVFRPTGLLGQSVGEKV